MSGVKFAVSDGRPDLMAILFAVAEKTGEHCEMRRGDNGNTVVTLNLNAEVARATDAAIADANSRFKGPAAPR